MDVTEGPISLAQAKKLGYEIPKVGYEIVIAREKTCCEKVAYLQNLSGRLNIWIWQAPCVLCCKTIRRCRDGG